MRVAGLDRAAAAFLASALGVAALFLRLPPPDWFQPGALLRSYAAGLFRKQTGSFLFRRLIEKSVACRPTTSRQASLALFPPEIMNAHQAKSFRRRQGAGFCRSAMVNLSIPPRDPQSVAR